jgi:hypothetical protein
MLDKKSIVVLLKLRFYQISFWFNAFHKDMNDLINVSNINSDHIKRALCDVFMMKNCKNEIWIEFIYEIDFYTLHYYMSMHLKLILTSELSGVILKM